MDFHKNARLILADHSFTRRDILNICPVDPQNAQSLQLPVLTAKTVEPISHRSNKYQVIVPQSNTISVLFFDGPFALNDYACKTDQLWDNLALVAPDTGVYVMHADSAQFLRLTWGAVLASVGNVLEMFQFEFRLFSTPEMGVARVTACPSGRKRRPGERLMRCIRLSITDAERQLWLEASLIDLPFVLPPPSEIPLDLPPSHKRVRSDGCLPSFNLQHQANLPPLPVHSLVQPYVVVVDPISNTVHVLNDSVMSRNIIDFVTQNSHPLPHQQPEILPAQTPIYPMGNPCCSDIAYSSCTDFDQPLFPEDDPSADDILSDMSPYSTC